MDGSRIRLLALAAPLVVGLTLAVAALLATPGPGSPPELQGPLVGPVRTMPTAVSSVLVIPRTTPPPGPATGAATGVAPAPAPEPAATASEPAGTP